MKKLLFIIPALAGGIFFHQLNGQPCTLGNSGVKLNSSTPGGAGCNISIDLYFDLKHNPGGKWFWVHIWPAALYSNWRYATPPTTGNGGLTGSIATFGVEHQGASQVVQPNYPPDPSVPGFQYSGLAVTEGLGIMPGSERYTVKNLQLTVPGGCNIPQSFIADVWESQSAQSQNVHCFVKGMTFYANDPTASGLLFCGVPRRYSFTIKTIGTSDMATDYNVYIDDGDGIFNIATDNILINSGSAVLSASNQYKYQSPVLGYLPYSEQKPYTDRDLWVEVKTASVPNAIYAQIVNSCIPLPVRISSFTAVRNKELVELKWVTASETNCKGFFAERMNSTGWEVVSFIPTQAAGGNSSAELLYRFTDYNIEGGVSLYRLRQEDVDNKNTYSITVSVKGYAQYRDIIVYPNPVSNGQITLVTDFSLSDITIRLIDMNGRLVKEWVNPATGRLDIGQAIPSGVYMLQVWNKHTGEKAGVKIVVSR